MPRLYWTYIMASRRNGTLYVGVTNDIVRRAWEHREGRVPDFTRTYGVKMLVHYEPFATAAAAIHRETRLKKWKRRGEAGTDRGNEPGVAGLVRDRRSVTPSFPSPS